MAMNENIPGRRIVTLALGLGVMVMAAQGGAKPASAKAVSGSLRCELEVKQRAGGVELQGVVFANAKVEGSYQLQIRKTGGGGSSDINQGGEFNAGPGLPARLGIVSLGGDDGSYSARLTVRWNGEVIECQRTGRA